MKNQILVSMLMVSATASAAITSADVTNLYNKAKMEVENRLPVLQKLVDLLDAGKISQAKELLVSEANTLNFAPLKAMILDNAENAKKVVNNLVAQLPPQIADVSSQMKQQLMSNQTLLNDIKAKVMSINENDINFAVQRAKDFGASLMKLRNNHRTEYDAFVSQLKMAVQKLKDNAETLKAFGKAGLVKVNDLVAYTKDVVAGKESQIDLTDAIVGFNALRDLLPAIFGAMKNGVDVVLSVNGQNVANNVATEVGFPKAGPMVIMIVGQVKDKADQAEQFITHQLDQLIGQ